MVVAFTGVISITTTTDIIIIILTRDNIILAICLLQWEATLFQQLEYHTTPYIANYG